MLDGSRDSEIVWLSDAKQGQDKKAESVIFLGSSGKKSAGWMEVAVATKYARSFFWVTKRKLCSTIEHK